MPEYRKLDPPRNGLSENEAYDEQPASTTREADNVRMVDPETGRTRMSQRSGSTDWTNSAVGGPVLTLCQVASGESQTTYTEDSDPDVDWSKATPSRLDAVAVQTDRQGNVYAIDGRTSLVKYNPDGREFFRFNFPAEDDENLIRALLVDDFDFVFAGTSEGADIELSKLWCYIPSENNKLEQLWQIEPEAYVEALALNEDQTLLYTIQNDTTRWQAWLRVYEGIGSSTPSLAWARQVPYPCNDLAVKRSGDALVASEAFANRGQSPRPGDTTRVSEDWTPLELDSYEERVWAWLDAKEIANQPEGYEDGDEVLFWRDKSGNGRHVYATSGTAPQYVEYGLSGLPAVRFDGIASFMLSAQGTSTSAASAGSQKNLLPGYTDAGFALFVVARCPNNASNRPILGQRLTAGTQWVELNANSTETNGAAPTAVSGQLSTRIQNTASGAGFAGQPMRGNHNNDAEIAIITLIYQGDGGTEESYFRVNGDPTDSFTAAAAVCDGLTSLGIQAGGTGVRDANYGFFDGDILEILVLRDYNSGTIATLPDYPNVTTIANSDTEVERVEGYLAHRWGVADQLDDGDTGGASISDPLKAVPTNNDPWPHPYELTNGPPASETQSGQTAAKLFRTGSLLSKFSANAGVPKWVLADDDPNPNITQDEVGGIGYGVRVNSVGEVYSIGPQTANDDAVVRKIRDVGDAYILDPVDGDDDQAPWAAEWDSQEDQNYKYPRMAVDSFDNLYVPKDATNDATALVVFNRQGSTPTRGTGVVEYEKTLPDSQRGRAVAVDPNVPDYQGDLDPGRAEFVALGTENGGGTGAVGSITLVSAPADGDTITLDDGVNPAVTFEFDPNNDGVGGGNIAVVFTPGDEENAAAILAISIRAQQLANNLDITTGHIAPSNFQRLENDNTGAQGNVAIQFTEGTPGTILVVGMENAVDQSDTTTVHRLEAVEKAVDPGSPRSFKTLAVAADTVDARTKIYTVANAAAPVEKTSSSLAFDVNTEHVSCAILFGKAYFTDGISRSYLVYDPVLDTVEAYESQVGGSPPNRCKLLSSWRQRLVFLRPESDPHMWHMTAAGNPLDNDLFPPVVTPATAIAGNLPERAGLVPDIINAFVPYSDDLAIIGCDHSIYFLRGDPQSDGQFDRVTDTIGMAFGDSWAKDPQGYVYFFGAQGGIFQMSPTGQFVRLSMYRIERQLQNVDLNLYDIVLAWNYQEEGLHVFQTKKGVDTTLVNGWFWEKKHDFWARDTWSSSGVQPSCAFIHDGDEPGDRHVLLGCEDGFVRKVDRDALDDDGNAVESSVILGPYRLEGEYETRLGRLACVLQKDSEHLAWEVSVTDNPEDLGTVVASGAFSGGRNATAAAKARGSYVYIRLSNFEAGSRWSLERMAAQMFPSGRRRIRV